MLPLHLEENYFPKTEDFSSPLTFVNKMLVSSELSWGRKRIFPFLFLLSHCYFKIVHAHNNFLFPIHNRKKTSDLVA